MNSLDLLTIKFDLIQNHCSGRKFNLNYNFIENLNELLSASKSVHKSAKKLANQLNDIPINGYFLFIEIVTSYLAKIVNQIEKNGKIDLKLIELARTLLIYKNFLIEVQKAGQSNEDHIMKKLTNSCVQFYEIIHQDRKCLESLHSKYTGFYMNKEMRKLIKFFNLQIALTSKLPFSLASLFSIKSRGKYFVKGIQNANLDYPFDIYHKGETSSFLKFLNYLNDKKLSAKIRSDKIQVPKQNRFRLDCKGNILDFENMSKDEINSYENDKEEKERFNSSGRRHRNKDSIKCRYIYIASKEKCFESLERIKNQKNVKRNKLLKHYTVRKNDRHDEEMDNSKMDKEINPQKVLVLFMHGGALFSMGSKSIESHLKDLSNNLGGIPILSIDYSLTVPYPVVNQEILDVYLWILSGVDDVKEKLGFYPKKIVLGGTSAGGFLSLSLTMIINELNKLIKKNKINYSIKDKIPLPNSIVASYSVLSWSIISPSKSIYAIDSLLAIDPFLIVYSLYGANLSTIKDFKKIENTERFQKIASKNQKNLINQNKKFESKIAIKNQKSNSTPWFCCDYSTYKNYADYIESFYDHPFIQPPLYENYEELKDVDLYLSVGDRDLFLDENLSLTNKWKGKMVIDLFEDCIHGFVEFRFFSKKNQEAYELVRERYQEACGLL